MIWLIIWLLVITYSCWSTNHWVSKIAQILDTTRVQQNEYNGLVSNHIYEIKKHLNMIDENDNI